MVTEAQEIDKEMTSQEEVEDLLEASEVEAVEAVEEAEAEEAAEVALPESTTMNVEMIKLKGTVKDHPEVDSEVIGAITHVILKENTIAIDHQDASLIMKVTEDQEEAVLKAIEDQITDLTLVPEKATEVNSEEKEEKEAVMTEREVETSKAEEETEVVNTEVTEEENSEDQEVENSEEAEVENSVEAEEENSEDQEVENTEEEEKEEEEDNQHNELRNLE